MSYVDIIVQWYRQSLKWKKFNTREEIPFLAIESDYATEDLAAMLHRANNHDKLVFTGGVADNLGIVRLLEQKRGISLRRPTHPDTTGAVGAALHGVKISR